ncbi:MAG TPA: hypothetical protein VF145_06705 [Chitinophagaceae bacterium]
MKGIFCMFLFVAAFVSCCRKQTAAVLPVCNINQTYASNAARATVTNGIWGTIASMEGNCMPVVNPMTCKTCPVQRKVRIYAYTQYSQATPQGANSFYDSFGTQLVKEVDADADGFYQADLAPGQYTIVVIENGKLYAFGFDGNAGISPFTVTGGKQNLNLTMTYKATF